MAEEAEGAAAEGGAPAAPKVKLSPQVLIVLANGVLILAALGVMVYTKLLYKRPAIVEEVEIQKKQEELKEPLVPVERSIVKFDQMVINIAMTSGKAHYATVAIAVECRDEEILAIVTAKKAQFTDKLIALLGKRQITELNTIQGKLLLKTELMREYSALTKPGGITDIYFSNFILQ